MFNSSSPKGTKPYLRLRITQFDIFVLNFTFGIFQEKTSVFIFDHF